MAAEMYSRRARRSALLRALSSFALGDAGPAIRPCAALMRVGEARAAAIRLRIDAGTGADACGMTMERERERERERESNTVSLE
jgi:hypothetical protein